MGSQQKKKNASSTGPQSWVSVRASSIMSVRSPDSIKHAFTFNNKSAASFLPRMVLDTEAPGRTMSLLLKILRDRDAGKKNIGLNTKSLRV